MNLSRRNFLRGAAAVAAVAAVKPIIPAGAYVNELPAWCPKGFLPCDGRTVLKSDYPALARLFNNYMPAYAKVSDDGRLTFTLPDWRGSVVRRIPVGKNVAPTCNMEPIIATEKAALVTGTIVYYNRGPDNGDRSN